MRAAAHGLSPFTYVCMCVCMYVCLVYTQMSKPQSSDELQLIVDAVTVPTVLISREHGKKIEYNLSFGKEGEEDMYVCL